MIITLREVMQQIETGRPFTCKFVTYDRRRKKGGEVREVDAVLLTRESLEAEFEKKIGRPLTKKEQETMLPNEEGRKPNHRHWYTRNIRLMVGDIPTAEIRKLHPPLIIEFNGMTVVP